MKKLLSIILICVLISGTVVCAPVTASAAENYSTDCFEFNGSNSGAYEYRYNRWASTVESYISVCADGKIMTVSNGSNGVVVCYYNSDYSYAGHIELSPELSVFGGFYETENNYFILTGQNNAAESSTVEVFRITKYDKNWKRISSVGLYDCNTVVPFDGGSARFAHTGKYLYIRTAHKMYTSSDGLNHQANVTIAVDTEKMIITDSFTGVMNVGYGYVSHSFNQFIKIDNGQLVAVDHGDAYPRSVVLIKYPGNVTDGTFFSSQCSVVNMLKFPGTIGDNDTGTTVGGFEVSSSSYIVAGTSVVLDSSFESYSTRNVFVATVSKNSSEPTVTYITDYKEGTATCSNPHLVKLTDERFLLLWSRQGKVYYTELDASGKKTSGIYSMEATLSDCAPIVNGSEIIWYTNNQENFSFYSINTQNIAKNSVKKVNGGHKFSVDSNVQDGVAELVCDRCGYEKKENVIMSFDVYRQTFPDSNYYTSNFNIVYHPETVYGYWIIASGSAGGNDTIIAEVEDERIATVSGNGEMGYITFLKEGATTITFRSKFNPKLSETYTLNVGHHTEIINETPATCTKDGKSDGVCNTCGEKVTKIIPATGHTSSDWKVDKKATVNSAGSKHKECTECKEVLETGKIAQLKCSVPKLKAVSNTSSGVKFSWGKVSGADSYYVYRKTSSGSFKKIGTTTGTSYIDKTAKSKTKYYYTVKAKNEAGLSSYNKTGLSIKCVKALSKPAIKSISNSSSGVIVKWNKVTNAEGYYIYRKTSGGEYKKIKTITKGSTVSYTDKTAKAGTKYYYVIKAYNDSVVSTQSTSLIIKRLTTPSLKSVSSAKSGVTFKWGKVTGASGYYVYRKTSGGEWQKIASVKGSTKVSYLDKSAKKGKTYYYTVRAYSDDYTSSRNTSGLKIKDKY